MDPLTALHHTGLYQQHMCRLIETVHTFTLFPCNGRCSARHAVRAEPAGIDLRGRLLDQAVV